MDWKHLIFSFEGRINRKPYWIAAIILVVIQYVAIWLGLSALGLTFDDYFSLSPDPGVATVELATFLLFLYPSLALGFKRLHDRNRSGWWLAPFVVLVVAFYASDIAGLSPGDDAELGLYDVFLLVGIAITLWLIVELAFLKGTQGPNRFGPDPLGATQTDASL